MVAIAVFLKVGITALLSLTSVKPSLSCIPSKTLKAAQQPVVGQLKF
jgi:hypothetical protein